MPPSPGLIAWLRPEQRGFTLIEVMVVVGIMSVILLAGIPSLSKLLRKEGMRKVTSDVQEVCDKARAQAILRGSVTEMMFHPRDHRVEVGSATIGGGSAGSGEGGAPVRTTTIEGKSAVIPEDFVIEMLDINLSEYKDSDWAKVRFYPNGTCDEMTLVLHNPQKNEWKKITLEVSTSLSSVDDVVR